jgi:hypothetical protein
VGIQAKILSRESLGRANDVDLTDITKLTSSLKQRRMLRGAILCCATLAAAFCLANAEMPAKSSIQRCQSMAFMTPTSSRSTPSFVSEGYHVVDACTGVALTPLVLRKPERERPYTRTHCAIPRQLGKEELGNEEDARVDESALFRGTTSLTANSRRAFQDATTPGSSKQVWTRRAWHGKGRGWCSRMKQRSTPSKLASRGLSRSLLKSNNQGGKTFDQQA